MKKLFLPLLLCIIMATGCSDRQAFRTDSRLLGTVINITAYGRNAEKALDKVLERVSEIHGEMARTLPESDVGRLNASNGEWVEISADTAGLIARGREYSSLTGGAFDIQVAPLVALWDVSGESPSAPAEGRIAELIPLIDSTSLELDVENCRARLTRSGAAVDLGSIAKGFACDEAVRILRENKVDRAVLDFGGNIYVIGEKASGVGWRVGLRNPVIGEEGIVCTLTLSEVTAVTSGGYERFFVENGKLYHHIMDPDTGYPADSGLLSVTIVCGDSAMADALSTACFVLGEEKALALLGGFPGVEAVFVGEDRGVTVTEGLKSGFSLANKSFFLREGNG